MGNADEHKRIQDGSKIIIQNELAIDQFSACGSLQPGVFSYNPSTTTQ
jgi:hypothetical protein